MEPKLWAKTCFWVNNSVSHVAHDSSANDIIHQSNGCRHCDINVWEEPGSSVVQTETETEVRGFTPWLGRIKDCLPKQGRKTSVFRVGFGGLDHWMIPAEMPRINFASFGMWRSVGLQLKQRVVVFAVVVLRVIIFCAVARERPQTSNILPARYYWIKLVFLTHVSSCVTWWKEAGRTGQDEHLNFFIRAVQSFCFLKSCQSSRCEVDLIQILIQISITSSSDYRWSQIRLGFLTSC